MPVVEDFTINRLERNSLYEQLTSSSINKSLKHNPNVQSIRINKKRKLNLMHFIIFVLASFNHLALFSGIIFPAECKTLYNLRHKLDYLCKYVFKLDMRSKQK